MKCASRDVQESVQGDNQGNGHNCIAGVAILTTMCFKRMKSIIFRIMYI